MLCTLFLLLLLCHFFILLFFHLLLLLLLSLHANVFIDNNRMARAGHRWYYEVHIQLPCTLSHLRVGWAEYQLFSPYPGSTGKTTTSGGLGDDLRSIGFDGDNMWIGGNSYSCAPIPGPPAHPHPHRHQLQRQLSQDLQSPPPEVMRVIGCFLDMESREMWFSVNGQEVKSIRLKDSSDVELSNTVVVPAISYSGGNIRLVQICTIVQ